MHPIGLVRLSIASPFLLVLDKIGLNGARILERARFPRRIRDQPECLIPTWALHHLLEEVVPAQGIDHLGLRVGHVAGLDRKGVHRFVGARPTLYAGLQAMCAGANTYGSQNRLWLEEQDRTVLLCYRCTPSPYGKGRAEMMWYGVGLYVGAVRYYLGSEWQPSHLGVPTTASVGTFALKLFPNTRFHDSSDYVWIAIPRRLMGAEAPACRETAAPFHTTPPDWPPIPADTVGSVREFVRAYLPSGHPPIELAAEFAETSVRSLQRFLASHGHGYSTLVEEVRVERSRELLREERASVIEVALETGYTDASHFARAFRRVNGVSPSEYRSHVQH